jgi:hypothetical protein
MYASHNANDNVNLISRIKELSMMKSMLIFENYKCFLLFRIKITRACKKINTYAPYYFMQLEFKQIVSGREN